MPIDCPSRPDYSDKPTDVSGGMTTTIVEPPS